VVSATRESTITEALVHHMCQQIVYRTMKEFTWPTALALACAASRSSISPEAISPSSTKIAALGSFTTARVTTSPNFAPSLRPAATVSALIATPKSLFHLYEEMGADCVQKLRGMFAFAIYDKTKRKLTLARDRLGKKPLHYALHNGNLYFASDIKSILAVAPELAEVNSQALLEYLYYGYVPDPITAFAGILPLLSDGFRDVLRRGDDPGNALRRYFTHSPAHDPLSQFLYVDTKTYMVGDILTKVDRMSMLNSLEVRAPILDHELEWAAGLSSAWKLRGRQQKYILLKLAERVGVPREALYRKKQGFASPGRKAFPACAQFSESPSTSGASGKASKAWT